MTGKPEGVIIPFLLVASQDHFLVFMSFICRRGKTASSWWGALTRKKPGPQK